LDGREILIKNKPGQVIHPEKQDDETGRTLPYLMQVPSEGMPSQGNPFVKGNLYIAFHVKFPDTLSPKVMAEIKKLLPDANMDEDYDPEHVEEHYIEEADLSRFGKGGAAAQSSEYDSDDDEGAKGQGVQCHQS
jgi:DnaJ homolog subfamily A member 2